MHAGELEPPPIVVVMGVSASGKTTLGVALAERMGWPFEEGDGLHPAANVAKMSAGQPLDDADRAPWLDRVARWSAACRAGGGRLGCWRRGARWPAGCITKPPMRSACS